MNGDFWQDIAEALAKVVGDYSANDQASGWIQSYFLVAEVAAPDGTLWLKTVKSPMTPYWRALGMLEAARVLTAEDISDGTKEV